MSVRPRQALYAHLRADQGVQAIVGDRIYHRHAPLDTKKPLIVIWPTISDVPIRDLNGVAYRRARLQVTAMAADDNKSRDAQPKAEAAAKAVISAVEGFSGMMAGALNVILATVDNDRQIDQEGVDEIHHHVDVIITYKEE